MRDQGITYFCVRHALRKAREPVQTEDTRNSSVPELMTGIVGDLKDLVSGHVDSVRGEVAGGVQDLKTVVTAVAIAASTAMVAALLAFFALAATLVALGLPTWGALWIVTATAALISTVFIVRARQRGRAADVVPDESLARIGQDARWVADRASDTVTGH